METAEQFNRQQLLLADAEAPRFRNILKALRKSFCMIARSLSLFQLRGKTPSSILSPIRFSRTMPSCKKAGPVPRPPGRAYCSRGETCMPKDPMKRVPIRQSVRLCPAMCLSFRIRRIALHDRARLPATTHSPASCFCRMSIQDIAKTFLSSINIRNEVTMPG